ncbi:hypothetical protein, conserved [Eimeria tenella]|uniref:Uncharacterized protein n=1 Tax=Eimeria tenella TaxID=5802 RepID=U6KRH2_EIMTE|nr:hypothetical protein, conserved [Eimeria tenella]CDJ39513.1 hypothetical protein, conserved [Eimeria tenella]|eukprot:XP_013230268.1 hypothetical protein, conserved [Eimeria tenella]
MEDPSQQALSEAVQPGTTSQKGEHASVGHEHSEYLANGEHAEPTGPLEGPEHLRTKEVERQGPRDDFYQHPTSVTERNQETSICIKSAVDLEELNDTGLTTDRVEELRSVFGPNAVKPKQVGYSGAAKTSAVPIPSSRSTML